MIQRHTVYNGPVREWVPGSPRPKPAQAKYCDQGCGTRLRSTNPFGRCGSCCERVGFPEDQPVAPIRFAPRGHATDGTCRCTELRVPLGVKNDGRAAFGIKVRCPDCNVERVITLNGAKSQPCHTDYLRRCGGCAQRIRKASGAKVKPHLLGCGCSKRRVPVLDDDGVQVATTRGRKLWRIEVTCPSCKESRLIAADGAGGVCADNYLRHCAVCAKQSAWDTRRGQ